MRQVVRQEAGVVLYYGALWSMDPITEAYPLVGGDVQVGMVTSSYVKTDRSARYEQPVLQCDVW